VFVDEMGVLLGLTRTHARSFSGSRVYDFQPFYRGAQVTVIGAISVRQVLAVMTLNGSRNGKAFKVFVEKCLLPQLWPGAVVVMDNVPAHKVVEIEPLIQSVGASVLYQSPYSPDFNPIEHWWSQLKAFLRSFSPTNAKMLDGLIAIALNARQSYSFKKLVYQLLLLYLIHLKFAVSYEKYLLLLLNRSDTALGDGFL
jgi:transposase